MKHPERDSCEGRRNNCGGRKLSEWHFSNKLVHFVYTFWSIDGDFSLGLRRQGNEAKQEEKSASGRKRKNLSLMEQAKAPSPHGAEYWGLCTQHGWEECTGKEISQEKFHPEQWLKQLSHAFSWHVFQGTGKLWWVSWWLVLTTGLI